MITRKALSTHVDDLLQCALFNDYAPNGLQIEGRDQIKRICTAVTASEEVILKAVAMNADTLIVHHGYFWKGEDPVLTGIKRRRVAQLLLNDMNLFAYHLPLDCHLELGNNACLARLFNIDHVQQHQAGKIDNLLWAGHLPKELSGNQLSHLLMEKLGRKPIHIEGNDRMIRTVAWCSGGAQDFLAEAHQLGVDAYLSGEISERTYYQAKELGIHYFACGHHATERYGIQALGNHISKRFGLEHFYIETNNPI